MMKMTIIAAHEGGLVDVQFEDGAIRRNVTYSHFNDGGVGNHEAGAAKTVKKRAEVEGKEIRNEINGKMMKIIKFESYHSVHVLVEDGSTFITSLNMFRKARLRYWQSKSYVPPAENSEKQI